MKTLRILLALAGAALIAVGMFVPIADAPVVGDLSYRRLGETEFIIVLLLAAVAVAMALGKLLRLIWLPAVGIVAVLLYTAQDIGGRVAQVRETVGDVGGEPLRDLVDAAVDTVDPQWGLGIVVAGVMLLALAAALPGKR